MSEVSPLVHIINQELNLQLKLVYFENISLFFLEKISMPCLAIQLSLMELHGTWTCASLRFLSQVLGMKVYICL